MGLEPGHGIRGRPLGPAELKESLDQDPKADAVHDGLMGFPHFENLVQGRVIGGSAKIGKPPGLLGTEAYGGRPEAMHLSVPGHLVGELAGLDRVRETFVPSAVRGTPHDLPPPGQVRPRVEQDSPGKGLGSYELVSAHRFQTEG